MTEQRDLPAGVFSSWLGCMRIALLGDKGAAVPCGECTACCRSSYFIHIRREETQTLARIPGELLFAAPDLPKGNVLLGYDEQGRCPMLHDDACSIYGDRPLTCRNYDCRVYTAAGVDADRALITERARRWAFSYPTKADRDQHTAAQAAARFLREHAECLPSGAVPGDPAHVAVLAVRVYEVFLGSGDGSGKARRASADHVTARAVMEVNEEFEAGREAPKAQGS
jgi:Fe-S-cluster containining protein